MDKKKQLNLLSERIRQARLAAHLSQSELGNGIGVSDKSISSYEKGRSVPSLVQLMQICEKTNHPLSFFTDDENTLSEVTAELAEIKEKLAKVGQKVDTLMSKNTE